MLIKFKNIVEKYGRPNGIIHIGAHLMEEREDYLELGFNNTIWVEANPIIFNQIKNKINYTSNEMVFNCAISDEDDNLVKFNITNNGQSSSILELDKHLIHHPSIKVIDIIEIKTKRMDSIISENKIDIDKYDFLNLDIQGAELLAMKGFGKLISKMKYIYTEVNTSSIYKNCSIIYDIDHYLDKYGFKRVETEMTEFEWGDALYIKK